MATGYMRKDKEKKKGKVTPAKAKFWEAVDKDAEHQH